MTSEAGILSRNEKTTTAAISSALDGEHCQRRYKSLREVIAKFATCDVRGEKIPQWLIKLVEFQAETIKRNEAYVDEFSKELMSLLIKIGTQEAADLMERGWPDNAYLMPHMGTFMYDKELGFWKMGKSPDKKIGHRVNLEWIERLTLKDHQTFEPLLERLLYEITGNKFLSGWARFQISNHLIFGRVNWVKVLSNKDMGKEDLLRQIQEKPALGGISKRGDIDVKLVRARIAALADILLGIGEVGIRDFFAQTCMNKIKPQQFCDNSVLSPWVLSIRKNELESQMKSVKGVADNMTAWRAGKKISGNKL